MGLAGPTVLLSGVVSLQRWVWKTTGLVKHSSGCDSVVLTPPALDRDSRSSVLGTDCRRLGVGPGNQRSPGQPHASWSLRATKLYSGQSHLQLAEDPPSSSLRASVQLLPLPLWCSGHRVAFGQWACRACVLDSFATSAQPPGPSSGLHHPPHPHGNDFF